MAGIDGHQHTGYCTNRYALYLISTYNAHCMHVYIKVIPVSDSLHLVLLECFSNLFSLGAESQPSEASLVTRLLEAGEGLAMNSFDSLADHLAVCGIEYKRKIHRDSRQLVLQYFYCALYSYNTCSILLPVVGLEKLLTEVSHRGLVDDKGHNPDFNPINYLAQHLMRNNPKHSSLSEAHLYCQSMQEVSEVLKKLTFSSNDEQLTQLKSDIKKRRLERENAESAHIEELKRRERMMKDTLTKWVVPGSIGMPISEVSSDFYSFVSYMNVR